jgi:RsmE family RNA methyltransferase
VGFPRPIQLRRLLRDCASLGLEAVDLMGTELGEKSYRDTNLIQDGGAKAALLEGAVQGRDTRLPHLGVYPALADWLKARPWTRSVSPDTASAEAAGAAADSPESAPLLLAADNVRPAGSFSALEPAGASLAVLAIGAERGWSGREREMLEEAGFTRLSLGSRALRTETACTAAAVLVMSKMGLL